MKIIENLFGEFVDACLGMDAQEAVEAGATYTLYGGHTIGFWILIGISVACLVACCVSKKFRSKFF